MASRILLNAATLSRHGIRLAATHPSVHPCWPRQPTGAFASLDRYISPYKSFRGVTVKGFASMSGAKSTALELEVVEVHNPKELNFILGHSHFIKTVEDIYEALVQSGTGIKFGLAFCEASEGSATMPGRRVRFDGNEEELIELAKRNAMAIGAGHSFIVFIDNAFPVNCLNAIKAVPEVCRVYCATANPTSIILAKLGDDRKGILGVVDGLCPTAFETPDDQKARKDFLRMIGYKR